MRRRRTSAAPDSYAKPPQDAFERRVERTLGPGELDGLDRERHRSHILLVGELAGAVHDGTYLVRLDDTHAGRPHERQVMREVGIAQRARQLWQVRAAAAQLDAR